VSGTDRKISSNKAATTPSLTTVERIGMTFCNVELLSAIPSLCRRWTLSPHPYAARLIRTASWRYLA